MDEIDAALDHRNVSIIAHYIKVRGNIESGRERESSRRCAIHVGTSFLFFFLSPSLSQERTKNAQFIIISLRDNLFELADRLVGVFKPFNCSNTVTIDPHKIAKRLESVAEAQAQPSLSAPSLELAATE